MNQPNLTLIVVCWGAIMLLIASAFIYFVLGTSSGPTKRRVFRWYSGVAAVMVAIWFTLFDGITGLVIAIALMVISIPLSFRMTRFCDACGAMTMNQFTRARFCPRCGADLDAQDRVRSSTTTIE